MNFIKATSKRIRDLLNSNNMTIYRLIKLTCLNEKTINDILNCKSKDIKLSTIISIAFAFNLSLSEFFDDDVFNPATLEPWVTNNNLTYYKPKSQ